MALFSAFPFNRPTLELVPGACRRSFTLRNYRQHRFDFVWHLHPEFELTWIERGSGVRYVGESIEPFLEGDLCLFAGGVPHAYGTSPTFRGECRWTVLHFLPEVWGDMFWSLPELKRIRKLFREATRGMLFRGTEAEAVRNLLLTLARPPRRSGMGPVRVLEILDLLSVAPRSLLNSAAGTNSLIPSIDPRIARVLAWLEERCDGEVSQAEAAAVVGMSGAAFSRFFRQQTGKLFSSHLNALRVARACAALVGTDHSVAEVAFASGFANLSNFNRRFLESTGMTPLQYRKWWSEGEGARFRLK